MKKGILVLFLVMAVGAGAFAGAQKEAAETNRVTLRFWAYSRWKGITGKEPTGENGDWHRNLVQEFVTKYPNVTIEHENLPFSGGPEKLSVAIASRTQPDILEDASSRIFGYVGMNLVLPVDDKVTAEELGDYIEGKWDYGQYTDGKHYMFPMTFTPVPLLINKTMFERAGAGALLPRNEDRTWTYDEFKAALKAVSKDGKYGAALYAGNASGQAGVVTLVWGQGTRLFNESRDRIVFNSPQGVKGLEFAVSLLREGIAVPGAETMKVDEAVNLFLQGKVATVLHGAPSYYAKNKDVVDFEMDWALPPTAPGVRPAIYSFPIGVSVFRSNEDKEKWAVEFGKFATNAAHSKQFCIATNYMPVRKSASDLYDNADPYMKGITRILKYAVDPGNSVKGFTEITNVLFPELQAAFAGTKNPKQALDDFAVRAEAVMEKYRN